MKKVEWKDRVGQLIVLFIYLTLFLIYVFSDGQYCRHEYFEFSNREWTLLVGSIIAVACGFACLFLGRRSVNRYHWNCASMHCMVIAVMASLLIYYY